MIWQAKKLLSWGFPLLILGVLLYFWILKGRDQAREISLMEPPVVTVRARRGPMARELRISGLVESPDQVTLVPRVPGRIDEIVVEVGDPVKKGEKLVRLDPESYRLTLLQAEAAYNAAESTYRRISSLYDSGSTSQESYNQAKAQYESLKSQYELARLQLSYTTLTSPLTGTVLATHINQGAMAGRETPILTVGRLTDLTVATRIPETYLPYFLSKDDGIIGSLTHPSLAELHPEARIKSIAPYVSPQTRDFTVTLALKDDPLLRPGMLLYVTYRLEREENRLHLPRRVLSEEKWIWYVDGEGRAQRLAYEPLFETDDSLAIPEAWEGYTFIVEGQHFLIPGQTVKVREAP